MNIFECSTYVAALQNQIEERRPTHGRGYQAKLARAAGIHGSYLSRVLREQVQLTPDQGARLCDFWRYSGDETDYFLGLLDLARAATPELRAILKRRLDKVKRRREDLSERFRDARELSSGEQAAYYSAWYFSAIHILLWIPAFRTPETIAKRLNLPSSVIQSGLKTLEHLGLTRANGKSWLATKTPLHLPNRSTWIPGHHASWRGQVIAKLPERNPDALHFTGVHAIGRQDFAKIRDILLDAIEKTRKVADASAEEELYCLCVDWLRA